ncbi:MFS transporter [Orbus mooreae]
MMKLPRLSLLSQICITHLISHIHMLVLPILMPVMLMTRQDIDFIKIGFAISVFNIVSAVVQAPVGIFVDKLGPKRVLIVGLIIGSLSFLSLGFINHYIWLIIAMAIAGLANAVYHPADYAILSQNVIEKKMGRAFSLHTFSGFVGFAITPTLMLTVSSFYNVNMAFIVSGVIGLIAALILIPKASNEQNKSQQDKQSIDKTVQTTKVKRLPLITPAIFSMFVLFLLLSLSGGSIQNFSVSALIKGYGISLDDANIALTAFLITSSVGVLVGGQLADYSKRHGLIATGALVITALIALIIATSPISSTIVITLLIGMMGFLSGIIAPSRDMLVRNIAPKGSEGRVFGIVSTGFNVGGTIGPILFGWLLDQNHPRGIFWSAAIFMVLTAMIAFYQEIKGEKRK